MALQLRSFTDRREGISWMLKLCHIATIRTPGISLDSERAAPSNFTTFVSLRYIKQPSRFASRKLAPVELLKDNSALPKLHREKLVFTSRALLMRILSAGPKQSMLQLF
jgi:hypothetical protein